MDAYQELLADIWLNVKTITDSAELKDWVCGQMCKDIEKLVSNVELALVYERHVKRNENHLYKGAKVRSKRLVPYSELFNDPQDTYRDDEGSLSLEAGLKGEIVEDYVDHEIDPEGYFDCTVLFETSESGLPLLCRVEWLEWEDDDNDNE